MTTSTLYLLIQSASGPCMPPSKTICIPMLGFGSMEGKHRYGTVEGRDRQVVTCLSTSQRPSTSVARTGSPRKISRASRCWEAHWGILLSWKVSCTRGSLNTRLSSTGSHCFQTYSLHGHCCCIALLPRPTISSEWLNQMLLLSRPGA